MNLGRYESGSSLRQPGADPLAFLAGGGEMGAIMRNHDWTGSSLSAPETWPQPLRTAVRFMLNTGHPMYIWWGADGACLYNNAYRSLDAALRPVARGRRQGYLELLDRVFRSGPSA